MNDNKDDQGHCKGRLAECNIGINGGKEDNVTLGLNWYPHTNLLIIFNYIRVNATNSSGNEGLASIFQARFQIAF